MSLYINILQLHIFLNRETNFGMPAVQRVTAASLCSTGAQRLQGSSSAEMTFVKSAKCSGERTREIVPASFTVTAVSVWVFEAFGLAKGSCQFEKRVEGGEMERSDSSRKRQCVGEKKEKRKLTVANLQSTCPARHVLLLIIVKWALWEIYIDGCSL